MIAAKAQCEIIAGSEWFTRPGTQKVFALLDGAQRRTRVVGGVVRDTLMERPLGGADVDFATELLPEEVMARAGKAGVRAVPTGIDHGTVTLVVDDAGYEVTTLRTDVETFGRHARVAFGTDWRADAERRDFTINALYAEMDGNIYDPLGGLADLTHTRVRFIGDPARRIAEDRLRVYRFFRFSASHGHQIFDAEGLASCKAAAHNLGNLSEERVGAEMVRMLALPEIARTIEQMCDAGVVSVSGWVLARLSSYEHHTIKGTLAARLAILAEDQGLKALQERWRLANRDVALARSVDAAARLIADGKIAEAAYRHPECASDAVALAAAYAHWHTDKSAQVYSEIGILEVPPFPVKGSDLLAAGLAQGPALGRAKAKLETIWLESGFRLGRDELLRHL